MSHRLLAGICISALCAVLPSLFLSPAYFLNLFIVLGYGHFILAYMYQWRANKMTRTFLFANSVCGVILFFILWNSPHDWRVALAGLIFLGHHFFDELRLQDVGLTSGRIIESSAPGFIYAALFVNSIFGGIALTNFFALCALGAILIFGIFLVWSPPSYQASYFTAYMLLILFGLLSVAIFIPHIRPEFLLGALVLYHYARWYIYSWDKLAATSERRKRYGIEVVVTNCILGLLFVLYIYVPALHTLLSFLFLPAAFYFWTIMHILASLLAYRNVRIHAT